MSQPPATPGPSQPPPSTPPPSAPPPSNPPAPKYAVQVDCAPVNTFGYIGWATGTLEIASRTADGSLAVKGGLKLRYHLVSDPETAKDVQVEGTLDKNGQYVSARVVSGAADLESVFLSLSSGVDSHIDGPNGSPSYQTRCAQSTADVPRGSDLWPDGSMSFSARGDGTIGVQINVVNIGNEPATGASGHATVGTSTVAAALYQYSGGTATAANTVNPGDRGYVFVILPAGALARCTQPKVVIDVDHTFQSGDPDPFANDTANVATPCLTWSRPINQDSMGVPPDAFLAGKTLGGIVSSAEVGRKDGNLCSACHYATSGNKYSPPVEQNKSATIAPGDMVGGNTWAGADGWASHFLTNPIGKPDYLKAVVKQWLDDGARP